LSAHKMAMAARSASLWPRLVKHALCQKMDGAASTNTLHCSAAMLVQSQAGSRDRRSPGIVLSIMLSIAVLLATATPSAPAAPKPNLLFMMADQLRADALGTGARNGGKPNTPNLDKLGNEGIRFTNSCENMQPCSHEAPTTCTCSDNGCQRSQQPQMHCMQTLHLPNLGGHAAMQLASSTTCTRAMFRWWLPALHCMQTLHVPDLASCGVTSRSFLLPSFATHPIRVPVYAYIVSAHPPTLNATTALTLCDTPPHVLDSSTPTCTPARAAILTGQSPWNHGMLGYGDVAPVYPFEMPVALQSLGYTTSSIGKDRAWNHARARARTHTHTHTHTQARTRTRTRTHARTRTHTHTQARTHTHTHTRAHERPHTHMHTHTHTHALTHARTHARTPRRRPSPPSLK
jgi:hypothetical protein